MDLSGNFTSHLRDTFCRHTWYKIDTIDMHFLIWNKLVNNWKTASTGVKAWTHYFIFSIHFVLKLSSVSYNNAGGAQWNLFKNPLGPHEMGASVIIIYKPRRGNRNSNKTLSNSLNSRWHYTEAGSVGGNAKATGPKYGTVCEHRKK